MATQPEGCSRLRWVDVSTPLYEGMLTWPNDPPFQVEPVSRIASGDASNVSRLSLTTHTGTHIDAPYHFCPSGARVHELNTGLFFGSATVMTVESAQPAIGAADLGCGILPRRLLLKTQKADGTNPSLFRKDYAALSPEAAARLVQEDVQLVGIDSLSIGPYGEDCAQTHRILLEAGVLVVEGLDLQAVAAGPCAFVVAPLAIVGGDGAPCRAFVGMEAGDG